MIDIDKLSRISRLNLTEQEKEKFRNDLEAVLDAFKILDEISTEGVEPSIHPFEIKNAARKDKAEKSLTQKEVLKNKEEKEGMLKGPRAV